MKASGEMVFNLFEVKSRLLSEDKFLNEAGQRSTNSFFAKVKDEKLGHVDENRARLVFLKYFHRS